MQDYVADDYHKGLDAVADSETCYDKPDRKQKHPTYENQTAKLMKKNNEFTDKKFQKIRNISKEKKILKSFKRIGRCLNQVSRDEVPKNGLDKVCLVLMNYTECKKKEPKVGALNDGYLFSLYHHRLGFKVFYLYNCTQSNYPKFLRFFLYNTTDNLSVYYSGPGQTQNGSNGIEFTDTYLTAYQLGHVISHDNNGKCKVIFLSDCPTNGSVFDISEVNKVSKPNRSPMVSISTKKSDDQNSDERKMGHGILTYYFCKTIYDNPAITAKWAVERINSFINRFGQSVICETTSHSELNEPLYPPCHHYAVNPIDEIIEEIGSSTKSSQSSNVESSTPSD